MNDEKIITDALEEVLLRATNPIEPAPEQALSMLTRLKTRIHDTSNVESVMDLLTVASEGGEWVEPVPGNEIKMLRGDDRTQSFLVRLHPGTRFPAHSHPEDEETLVLEGEVLFGDIPLKSGDYHLARKGSFHDEVYSENGCLLFIRAGTAQN